MQTPWELEIVAEIARKCKKQPDDWTRAELAEFDRLYAIKIAAGAVPNPQAIAEFLKSYTEKRPQ